MATLRRTCFQNAFPWKRIIITILITWLLCLQHAQLSVYHRPTDERKRTVNAIKIICAPGKTNDLRFDGRLRERYLRYFCSKLSLY